MARTLRTLLALSLFALVGCGDPEQRPGSLPNPDLDDDAIAGDAQYGPPAGSDAEPVTAPAPDHSALGEPGQPPDQTNVPTGAGGTADREEDPAPFNIHPPSDLGDQPPAPGAESPSPAPTAPPPAAEPAPHPAGEPVPPVSEQPEEPGTDRS